MKKHKLRIYTGDDDSREDGDELDLPLEPEDATDVGAFTTLSQRIISGVRVWVGSLSVPAGLRDIVDPETYKRMLQIFAEERAQQRSPAVISYVEHYEQSIALFMEVVARFYPELTEAQQREFRLAFQEKFGPGGQL